MWCSNVKYWRLIYCNCENMSLLSINPAIMTYHAIPWAHLVSHRAEPHCECPHADAQTVGLRRWCEWPLPGFDMALHGIWRQLQPFTIIYPYLMISMVIWVEKKTVCKSWSQKQIMWFPSGGLHIYVSALDSELFELELVASTSELLSATSYP